MLSPFVWRVDGGDGKWVGVGCIHIIKEWDNKLWFYPACPILIWGRLQTACWACCSVKRKQPAPKTHLLLRHAFQPVWRIHSAQWHFQMRDMSLSSFSYNINATTLTYFPSPLSTHNTKGPNILEYLIKRLWQRGHRQSTAQLHSNRHKNV